jgi:acetyl esterase/lipase
MMQTFTIDLWTDAYDDGFRPTLDAYIISSINQMDTPRPGVLVLPGSGYSRCSPREAEALALRFNVLGCHAFVLWYSCAPHQHPLPLQDCCRAFTIIRQQASEWNLDPKRLAMMGFSAGGHLALSETLYYSKNFVSRPGIDQSLCRPDALMLCYPVVTSGEYAHRGSFEMLLGKDPAPGLLDMMSLEKHITPGLEQGALPPVFIWHTWADASVPVENSLLLSMALRKAGVPTELHIFPEGRHGISLATKETWSGDAGNINEHTAQWFGLCASWLKKEFGI